MEILKQRISEKCWNALLECDIQSIDQILTLSELTISELTNSTLSEAKLIINEAINIILKVKFITALQIPEWSRLSTGCKAIDLITRGGIPLQVITEVVGTSGVGKSQFCLQLALMVQFPKCLGGLNKGAVYICTEDSFPSKRLHQLAHTFPLHFNDLEPIKFMESIYLKHVANYEQLRRCLYIDLPKLIEMKAIGLIIIDSIAGIYRSENLDTNYMNRSKEFAIITSQLCRLGKKYDMATICVNQVTDNPENGKTVPCLGLAWSNLVTCRFEINRLGLERQFKVIFAPDLSNNKCNFCIKEHGIEDT